MSAKRKKKEEEKPPPAVGPGSMIRSLAAPLRKHLPKDEKGGIVIAFSTAGMRMLPLEVRPPPPPPNPACGPWRMRVLESVCV